MVKKSSGLAMASANALIVVADGSRCWARMDGHTSAPVILRCVDFKRFSLRDGPNPRSEPGIRFRALGCQSQPEPQTRIQFAAGFTGLSCGSQLEIELPEPVAMVEMTLVTFAQLGKVEAFSRSGRSVSSAAMNGPTKLPETVRLVGNAI